MNHTVQASVEACYTHLFNIRVQDRLHEIATPITMDARQDQRQESGPKSATTLLEDLQGVELLLSSILRKHANK